MALVIETEKYRLKDYQSVEILVMKEKAKDEFEDDAYLYKFIDDGEYWRMISPESLNDLYEKMEEE